MGFLSFSFIFKDICEDFVCVYVLERDFFNSKEGVRKVIIFVFVWDDLFNFLVFFLIVESYFFLYIIIFDVRFC